MIDKLFSQARRKAWASISDQEIVRKLIREQQLEKQEQLQKQLDTSRLLTMYK